jgi:hypothetical protein
MTQLDVLFPLLLWKKHTKNNAADDLMTRLLKTLSEFDRPQLNYVTNNFPPHPRDSFMDTWYFLENALIKLPWVAHLTGDENLKSMFFNALQGARTLAYNSSYLFPLFADASDWKARNSLLNVGVAGLYAAGCVMGYQLSNHDKHYLTEAAIALKTMIQLPPHQLTHEPQQLTFSAAAAAFLAKHDHDSAINWAQVGEDIVRLSLRMGYWGKDPGVPFYDPRGMFQACASLCYPAYKENVETLLGWGELLKVNPTLAEPLAAFANLQRCHNYAFFDPYLPEELRRGPCPYIPYEDIATTEFWHTAKLGKELYGTGEIFWSALLFDILGRVENQLVLCMSLDIPCLEMNVEKQSAHYLLYNPTDLPVTTQFQYVFGQETIDLPARSAQILEKNA